MLPFHSAVERWFREAFARPTRAQELAWPAIAWGQDVLLVAPTGSGKTLATFLALLDRLVREPRAEPGVRVLYVSPLKALNNDIHRNLELPLVGIAQAARELGLEIPEIRTAVRTGDTLANERHRMTRKPPHILITTPESLYLILTSPRAREMLRTVEHVIVDEIHAVAGTKRGAHLALSLERLAHLAARDFQRIGLSATQRPLERIAEFLGGGRPVTIVDAGQQKAMELRVESPIEDFAAISGDENPWATIEPWLLAQIHQHQTTLVFVNNRRSAERLTAHLNGLAGERIARAHHGSMSREERYEIEAQLKAGQLRAVVATGSLELGIDIGSVDLVICVESPRGIAKGLQRVGRSGHLVGETSHGKIVPKWRGDLVECAAVAKGMAEADVEPTRIVRNPLDVLAQQIVAMSAVDEWTEDELYGLVRRAWSFRDVSRGHFEAVLGMLSGKYPAEEFGELRPRIVWDKQNHLIRGRPGALRLATISGGTIPDRGLYPVYHQTRNAKLGELDEENVNELRTGDVILLGASTWKISDITPQKVLVVDGQGAAPTVPFWKGDAIGRTYELGVRVAQLYEETTRRQDEPGAIEWLKREYSLDDNSAVNLLEYVRQQHAAVGLPGPKRVVVETYTDELGDRRIVLHAPFGRMVLTPWTHALVEAICRDGACGDVSITDDGVMIRFPEQDRRPPLDLLRRVTRANVDALLLANLSRSRLFAARFRENAQRALLLPRRGPGMRTPLWLQRLRAADLLEVARKFDDFPIVHETIREILEDWFDLPRLREILKGIEEGEIEVVLREVEQPSPFATALAVSLLTGMIEEGDRQQPEFRQVMLQLDRALLRDLLGTTSLRELLDPAAIAEMEARLQRTAPEWRAKNKDEVEDLLVRLGDLSVEEVVERTEGDAETWLRELEEARRIRRLRNGRWAFEEESRDRASLVRRHLATHGPVTRAELEARFLFGVADVLDDLEREQLIVSGEFTRGRTEIEYVDGRVLEEIHRLTLSRLRKEIEARDPATYTRFLLRWHGVTQRDREVADVLEQLQGVWLPVEVWERDVVPARVPGYKTSDLDQACASGEFVWVARKGGPSAQPRVAFFRRDDLAHLFEPAALPDTTELGKKILEALRARGAVFLAGVASAIGAPAHETLDALWDLVWAGLVTNDAFDPLRHAPKPGELTEERNLTRRDASREARHRAIRTTKAGAGRWSLLLPARAPVEKRARAEAWARVLLERHGVLAYEHFEKEETPVPWALVSDVLRRWEMRGEARRGYFVEGFEGMQFAHPAAVERLRDPGDDTAMRLVATMDPANPYGSALPSPGEGFARIPGTYLVFEGGQPVLRVDAGGKRVAPVNGLAGGRLVEAVSTLSSLLRAPAPYRGKRLEVHLYGDEPAVRSQARLALGEAGFEESGRAMILWPSRALRGFSSRA